MTAWCEIPRGSNIPCSSSLPTFVLSPPLNMLPPSPTTRDRSLQGLGVWSEGHEMLRLLRSMEERLGVMEARLDRITRMLPSEQQEVLVSPVSPTSAEDPGKRERSAGKSLSDVIVSWSCGHGKRWALGFIRRLIMHMAWEILAVIWARKLRDGFVWLVLRLLLWQARLSRGIGRAQRQMIESR